MESLSHQEIREVQAYVKSIRYPTDIFTQLPLELSQRIAQYLGPFHATRARRVCKDWLKILTSDQTTRCLLRPWHGNGESTLRIPDSLSQSAISSLKAEHISAYRSGTAFDKITIQRPISKNGTLSPSVAYSSGKVAWFDKDTTTTHILSLEDNGACLTNKGDGGRIINVALSDSLFVVITLSGECRITELSTGLEHRFPIRPEYPEMVVVAKNTVAILNGFLKSSPMWAIVTTWTLGDLDPVQFHTSLHRSLEQSLNLCDVKIMVDALGKSVIIFERVIEARKVYSTRLSLAGRVQAEGVLELPFTECDGRHSEKSTPTETNGWATAWSYSKVKPGARRDVDGEPLSRTMAVLRVQYATTRNVLQLRVNFIVIPAIVGFSLSDLFFRHDVAYCHLGEPRCTFLTLIDFSKSFTALTVMGEGLSSASFAHRPRRDPRVGIANGRGMLDSLFLGDDRFLVNACPLGFVVWAFDKNHGMSGTDEGFKKAREKARRGRHGPWALNWPGHG